MSFKISETVIGLERFCPVSPVRIAIENVSISLAHVLAVAWVRASRARVSTWVSRSRIMGFSSHSKISNIRLARSCASCPLAGVGSGMHYRLFLFHLRQFLLDVLLQLLQPFQHVPQLRLHMQVLAVQHHPHRIADIPRAPRPDVHPACLLKLSDGLLQFTVLGALMLKILVGLLRSGELPLLIVSAQLGFRRDDLLRPAENRREKQLVDE